VLAGVWGAGKTTLMRACATRLAAHPCDHLIVVPQAATVTTHTYTRRSAAEQAAGMGAWIETLTGYLEVVDAAWRASTLPGHRFAPQWEPTALIEGLGFDAPVYGLPLPREEMREHEARLACLGLHLFVLAVPPERIREQCVRSTRLHRGPRWGAYLETLGAADDARAARAAAAQDALMSWAAASPMPLTVLDADPDDYERTARTILTAILREESTTRVPARPRRPSE
jgi:hypothetical protein